MCKNIENITKLTNKNNNLGKHHPLRSLCVYSIGSNPIYKPRGWRVLDPFYHNPCRTCKNSDLSPASGAAYQNITKNGSHVVDPPRERFWDLRFQKIIKKVHSASGESWSFLKNSNIFTQNPPPERFQAQKWMKFIKIVHSSSGESVSFHIFGPIFTQLVARKQFSHEKWWISARLLAGLAIFFGPEKHDPW